MVGALIRCKMEAVKNGGLRSRQIMNHICTSINPKKGENYCKDKVPWELYMCCAV